MAAARDLFDMVAAGNVSIEVNQTYPLSDTAQAHIDLARMVDARVKHGHDGWSVSQTSPEGLKAELQRL